MLQLALTEILHLHRRRVEVSIEISAPTHVQLHAPTPGQQKSLLDMDAYLPANRETYQRLDRFHEREPSSRPGLGSFQERTLSGHS
jgi:hypothetical protein